MSPAKPRKKKTKPAELNPKQQTFVREYALCCNLEEAQRRAGYQPNHGNARRILDDPRCAKLLKEHTRKADELAQVHLGWVLANLKKLGGANLYDMIEIDEAGSFKVNLAKVSRELAYAIQELGFDGEGRVKIKLHDKVQANKFLFEHLAPERPARVRLEGPGGGPVEIIGGLGERLKAAKARVKVVPMIEGGPVE
jgi:hypothetical protein